MCEPSKEILAAFADVQQPRSDYALEHFVVGSKFTAEAQYAQCVLEAQIKWDNIRLGRLELERIDLEIAGVSTPGRLGEIEKEKKWIEREQTERAMLGAERELACLCKIFEQFPEKFTYPQLQAAQGEEQRRRLCLQALQDMRAFGYISPGNQDALRQIRTVPVITNGSDGRVQIAFKDAQPEQARLKGTP